MDAHENQGPTASEPQAGEQAASQEAETAAEEQEQCVESKPVAISFAEYEELKTLAAERDEYLRRLRRAVADYLNLQKRIEKIKEAAGNEALRRLARQVVPLADSLTRALEAAEQAGGAESITEGVRMIEKEFYAILDGLGIETIEAEGKPFDPNYHEAVLQLPDDGAAPNTVIKELRKGFLLGEELLRPTQVIVAAAPPQSEREGQ